MRRRLERALQQRGARVAAARPPLASVPMPVSLPAVPRSAARSSPPRRSVASLIIAATLASAPGPSLSAQREAAPWFGTWQLDVARSQYPGRPPYRRATCVIEPWGDGLQSICDMVRVRGGVTHLEWSGRFDGRDYPVLGVEEHVTYAYMPRDQWGYDVVIKLDGQEAGRSRITISGDGLTMSVVTRQGGAQTTSVYRRE